MATLLSKAGKELTVTVLLDTLQQTKDFELSMAKKFGASVSFVFAVQGALILSITQLPDILQATSPTPVRPLQSISSSFEPHMGVYVQHQDKWVHLATLWSPCVLIRVPEQSPTFLVRTVGQRQEHRPT